jgi:hypothetical protein
VLDAGSDTLRLPQLWRQDPVFSPDRDVAQKRAGRFLRSPNHRIQRNITLVSSAGPWMSEGLEATPTERDARPFRRQKELALQMPGRKRSRRRRIPLPGAFARGTTVNLPSSFGSSRLVTLGERARSLQPLAGRSIPQVFRLSSTCSENVSFRI